MSALWTIIVLAVVVLSIAGLWMMFQKAGEAGWKSIIPIWNTLVILKMVGREWWWIILLIVPIVGFVVWIIVMNDLSKSFGHGVGLCQTGAAARAARGEAVADILSAYYPGTALTKVVPSGTRSAANLVGREVPVLLKSP